MIFIEANSSKGGGEMGMIFLLFGLEIFELNWNLLKFKLVICCKFD